MKRESEKEWYYNLAETREGPVSSDEVRSKKRETKAHRLIIFKLSFHFSIVCLSAERAMGGW